MCRRSEPTEFQLCRAGVPILGIGAVVAEISGHVEQVAGSAQPLVPILRLHWIETPPVFCVNVPLKAITGRLRDRIADMVASADLKIAADRKGARAMLSSGQLVGALGAVVHAQCNAAIEIDARHIRLLEVA